MPPAGNLKVPDRYLVVGGAGFLGSALVRLLSTHAQVRVLDNLSTGSPANLEGLEGVELVVGSVLDRDMVAKVLNGIDVVFHLACLGVRHSLIDPVSNHQVNASGTLTLLEEARSTGIRRFVHTSSSEVYGSAQRVPMDETHPTMPNTVYGGSKLAGEAYVRAYHRTYGMPVVVLRPFNAYGPRSHHEGDSGEVIPKFLVRTMNGLPPVVFGDGSQIRDFTHVDDTAMAIERAACADDAVGLTINIGTGVETSVSHLARLVASVAGHHSLDAIHADPRPGDVTRLVADSSLAREVLDWSPRVGLEDGIRSLLDWHLSVPTDWQHALSQEHSRSWEEDSSGRDAFQGFQAPLPPDAGEEDSSGSDALLGIPPR